MPDPSGTTPTERPTAARPIGLGCMRLSADDISNQDATAVIHAGLDAGVTLLDTARAYAPAEDRLGHNETLVASALASWRSAQHRVDGDRATIDRVTSDRATSDQVTSGQVTSDRVTRDRVIIATKGGMTRSSGRWQPDGRARQLTADCDHSRQSLSQDRLQLYFLHAPDPRTPLATSVRALVRLQERGWIERIGLSNVSLPQLEAATAIATIDAIQIGLSPWDLAAIRGGLVRRCHELGILVLVHSPFGGPRGARRLARERRFDGIAARHQVSRHGAILAWLRDLSPLVVPLPGATRVQSATQAADSARIDLQAEDRQTLAGFLPSLAPPAPPAPPLATNQADAEVVLVIGGPGAGKTAAVDPWLERGYLRLNRDERGGRLAGLLPHLQSALASGQRRVVLDNTYPSRASRNEVVEIASRHQVPVRCVWLDTPLAQAHINACLRLHRKFGALPDPEQLRAARSDPHCFGPRVQFSFWREFEPPSAQEGFVAIERRPFVRTWPSSNRGQAVLVECEGVLRRSASGQRSPLCPDDVQLIEPVAAALRRWHEEGMRLACLSWQPTLSDGAADGTIDATFERTRQLLGVPIEFAVCPHPAGPPVCWCRRPLPGLAVSLIERHGLDPAQCRFVGKEPADAKFAAELGFEYIEMTTL